MFKRDRRRKSLYRSGPRIIPRLANRLANRLEYPMQYSQIEKGRSTMRRILLIFTLSALMGGTAVWAQEATDTGQTTEAEAREVTKGYLNNELVSVKPQVGALVFNDQLGNTTSRIAGGLTVDANLASFINKDWGMLYLGPSTGLIY